MGEAPGMRCTRDSYLVFNARLSSCRDLTNFEVNPKPGYIGANVVRDRRSFGRKANDGYGNKAQGLNVEEETEETVEREMVRETYVLREIL